ncbi:50S ribosomal protein L19 [Patescibacteria group bacterium]|nr:50S ribosomal protein L19 [Patescibacteria group bacterium]
MSNDQKQEFPNQNLEPGMMVRVHEKIKDVGAKGQERERVQVFEGLIIGTRGKGISKTMTVRKNAKGWMVEKIYPLASPNIAKVEIVKKFRTRRAKLTYLRGKFKRKLKVVS